jgi:hypothetical protein
MEAEAKVLEEKAHELLGQEKFKESFKLFRDAATIYRAEKKHKQAALCFAAAAGCWNKECGESAFYHSAIAYQQAAQQSEAGADFEYAALLYKYAAINYERDGEFVSYSDCFYRSKECYRKFLTRLFTNPKKIHHIVASAAQRGLRHRLKYFFAWALLSLSCLVWGHGERPGRAFVSAVFVILLSAVFYTFGGLTKNTALFRPDFWEALYFSTITFTTVGYGDITPAGWIKVAVIFEAFCGVFIMPLFIVALSRKYLRV